MRKLADYNIDSFAWYHMRDRIWNIVLRRTGFATRTKVGRGISDRLHTITNQARNLIEKEQHNGKVR